jgi:hypothetical protein
MRIPKYKTHSLVGLYKIRLLRYEFLETPNKRFMSWGASAAYNANRLLRIANLPLDESEFNPWRQYVLHEVIYFNNRIFVYQDRWQKAFERCFLALWKLKKSNPVGRYNLWQNRAFAEAARQNLNYQRPIIQSRFKTIPVNWDESFAFNAWLLRQKPPPVKALKTSWDLAFSSITRDLFRSRRYQWDAAAKRAVENFEFPLKYEIQK